MHLWAKTTTRSPHGRSPHDGARPPVHGAPVTLRNGTTKSAPDARKEAILKGAFLVFLFCGSLILASGNLRFPVEYHRDEPSKVEQILVGTRNLNHPVLMLETVQWAVRIGGGAERQQIAIIGRWVSAVFMALAVVILALAAGECAGLGALAMVGFLAAIHFRFFEASHYFKEDTVLLFGWSLFLLCSIRWGNRFRIGDAVMLGIAAGIASSGKYIGALTLPVGLVMIAVQPAVFLPEGTRKTAAAAWFLAAAAGVFGLVHLRVFLDPEAWSTLWGSVSRETSWMVAGHQGYGHKIPHLIYWYRLLADLGYAVVMAPLFFFLFTGRNRRVHVVWWVTAVGYFVVLSCTRKYSDRYLLPVTMLVIFYAGIAACRVCTFLWERRSWSRLCRVLAISAVGFPVLIPGVLQLADYYRRFERDSRHELCVYLRDHAPADAVVACDSMVRLPVAQAAAGFPGLENVRSSTYASDMGTYEDLVREGVTHVVISYDTYHRFVAETVDSRPEVAEAWQRARRFYLAVKERGRLLWESPARDPKPLHPGLELYEIVPSPKT